MFLIFSLSFQFLVFFVTVVSGLSADLMARIMMSVAVLTAFTTLYHIKNRYIISKIYLLILLMILITAAYVGTASIVVTISAINMIDALAVLGCLQFGLYALSDLLISGIAVGESGESVSYFAGFDDIRYGKVYADGFFDIRVVDFDNGHECRFSISELDNILFERS